jgi:porin
MLLSFRFPAACVLPFLFVSTSALAAADAGGLIPLPDYSGTLTERQRLLGDAGGERRHLAEQGLTLDWTVTQMAASQRGGEEADSHYGIKSEALFTLDMDRAGLLPGALLTLRAESRAGSSANTTAGALLPVNDAMFFPQPADADFALYITELRYTQLLSPRTGFFVGKFTTLGGDLNEFSGGRGDTQFLTFNGNSVSALFGPYSTVGAGVFYNPTPRVNVGTSLVASTDSSSRSGLDTLDDGLIWTVNAGLQYQLGALPGGMRGSWQYAFDNQFYDFNRGPYLTPEGVRLPFEGESWAFVANGWQYLFTRETPGEKPVNLNNGQQDLAGLGVWFRAGVADADTNPVEWGVSAGVGGKGLIDSRPLDTFGIGLARAKVKEVRFITNRLIEPSADRLEMYYDAALTPALHLSLHYNEATPLLTGIETAHIFTLRLKAAL